jgi:hypothetical protein
MELYEKEGWKMHHLEGGWNRCNYNKKITKLISTGGGIESSE